MLKRIMISTAAAALLAGSAIAQSPPPMHPQKQAMPDAKKFVTQQAADQWLASNFKGTDVIGANDEKIGDVSDVLFDHNGRLVAYVIGVGGFLGIGTKDVALSPASFQVEPATDRGAVKLRLAMSKDELKNAPEFKPVTRPVTTGQAPRGDSGQATQPAAPAVKR